MSATDKVISLGKLIEAKLIVKSQATHPSNYYDDLEKAKAFPGMPAPEGMKLQFSSAQASDIEKILKDAKVWELSDAVSPLLNQAGVPDNVSIQIDLKVDSAYNVSYIVKTNPAHNSGNILARLLKAKFGNQMKAAIAASKPTITQTVDLSWLKF